MNHIECLEMKCNEVLEKKNPIGLFKSRLDTAEVRISELEDSTEKIMQNVVQRSKEAENMKRH